MGMTRSGAFVGTPKYMSPEQVEAGKVDHRSDLYSLGLVIYEMATGEVPFAGESTWQVMYQRVKEKPKDPKLVNPNLPDWVVRIILHCLEKITMTVTRPPTKSSRTSTRTAARRRTLIPVHTRKASCCRLLRKQRSGPVR
jgi:serine/threonine protein kinase